MAAEPEWHRGAETVEGLWRALHWGAKKPVFLRRTFEGPSKGIRRVFEGICLFSWSHDDLSTVSLPRGHPISAVILDVRPAVLFTSPQAQLQEFALPGLEADGVQFRAQRLFKDVDFVRAGDAGRKCSRAEGGWVRAFDLSGNSGKLGDLAAPPRLPVTDSRTDR